MGRLTRFVVLASMLILACGPASAVAGRSDVRSTDDLLSEVAGIVPEFGGMFIDSDGRLAIYLTDKNQLDAARVAVAEVFGRDRVDVSTARALPALYTFGELKRWHDQHRLETLAVPGVVMTTIHKMGNRLRVGVENAEVARTVAGVLEGVGVPAEVVEIRVVEPFSPFALEKLNETRRPLVGGLQITAQLVDQGLPPCTLGFLAVRQGQAGFVINSHCTNIQGGTEGTVYHQAVFDGSDDLRVGIEAADPSYFTGSVCPAGKKCRFSDAAFIARNGGPSQATPRPEGAFGRLARPDSSLAILYEYEIVASVLVPLDGEVVQKVGRVTGLTSGKIIDTCADINLVPTDKTLLCQSIIDQTGIVSVPGDSGSPIFQAASAPGSPQPAVSLFGLLWGGGGGNVAFSPMAFIEGELGPLKVFSGGLGLNSPPEVKIVEPQHFTNVGGVGALNTVQLKADIVDYEGCCQSVTWTSDKEGVIAQGPDTEFIISTPGAHNLTVTVTDDDGATASHGILIGADTDLPKVTIVEPTGGPPLYAGALYVFAATSQDPNAPYLSMPCSALTWTSSNPVDPFPVTGCEPKVTFMTPGPRTLTLTGKGAFGLTAVDTVQIQVASLSENFWPTVTILKPLLNDFLHPFTTVTLTGTAVDQNPGPLHYQWMLVQGPPPWKTLAAGTVNSGGTITLPWKPADHIAPSCGGTWVKLWLVVNNPGTDASALDSVEFMVGYPPC